MSKNFGSFKAIIAAVLVLTGGAVYAQSPESESTAKPKLKVISNSGSAGTIGKFAADGTTMVNSLIVDTGTQIGINASPAAGCFFDIGGVTRGEARFDSRQGGSTTAGSGSGFFVGTPTGDYAGLQLTPTMDLDFWAVPAAGGNWFRTMTILNNGNIGVNTNTPARKFHVNGLVRADDWFESRKGGSDTIDAGSGFHLGTATANYSALQLSANNNLDFWTYSNSSSTWARSMTIANDGKVGMGTAAPVVPLHIFNNTLGPVIRASYNGGGGVDSYYMDIGRSWLDTHNNEFDIQMDGSPKVRVMRNGWVGIGTTTPSVFLEVKGLANGGAGRRLVRINDTTPLMQGAGGGLDFGGVIDASGTTASFTNLKGVKANALSGDNSGKLIVSVYNAVNVSNEIGTFDLGGLAVTGNITATGNIAASGSITGATVVGAVYQDLAEWVPASTKMDPGTVVVLNRDRDNEVMPSAHAYDTAVAGVVSAQPGLILGVGSDSKAQIATTGRVKVHVDATKGAVAVGDLLVTGDKLGTAMKSQPIDLGGVAIHRPGTVIGKALQPLPNGEGDILVLLSLQ